MQFQAHYSATSVEQLALGSEPAQGRWFFLVVGLFREVPQVRSWVQAPELPSAWRLPTLLLMPRS
jgi:hypothetical protein